MTENADALLKDPNCRKSKEHFTSAVRVLELVQTNEIDMLLETIIGVNIDCFWIMFAKFRILKDLHGKEKEMLVNESKEKINTRTKALDRAKEVKAQLKM